MPNRAIKNPWEELLLELVQKSRTSIKITSPFIKSKITNSLLGVKRDSTGLQVISNFKLMNFYRQVSDFAALEAILESNGEVKSNHLLHAKTYIFDNKKAVVTSANLTNGGVTQNFEYGVLIDEQILVKTIVKDFEELFADESSGEINLEIISTAKTIISHLPKEKRISLPKIEDITETAEIDIYTGGIESIRKSLEGWRLETFDCLTRIKENQFSLREVYLFEKEIRSKFPENKHIKAKLRQQLQELRDIGIVEFLGHGSYRKLWTED